MITAIGGTAGVGKTALAIHWAHRVADRFPDGQLYLNLRGFDPSGAPVDSATAIRDILDALQVPPQRIPTSPHGQASLYRSMLAGRRMLLLLDNASDAKQVRPLLPGTPGCLVVVTSRSQMSGLATAEGAHTLTLDLPTVTEARQLLARRLGADRVAAEPDATDEIIARCGQLPLALAVVASRAATHPGFPLRVFADDLHQSGGNLDAFTDADATADVRAVFSWSYDTLNAQAARLFRLLGLHPGPDFTTAAAASLAGIPVQEVREQLNELIRAHLINEHVPGRYTFHDLLRAHASELAHHHDTEPDRRAAQHRLLDHYLLTAYNAAMLLNPHREPINLAQPQPGATLETINDRANALSWFATEHRLLGAATAQAASIGFYTHAWQLAWCLVDFFRRQGHWHDWAATHHTALDAARKLADPLAQALTHRTLASAHQHLGHDDDALGHLLDALDRFDELGDQAGQAHTHMEICILFERQCQYHEAFSHARLALDLYRATGDLGGEATALNGMGWLHVQLGDHRQAIRLCRQALALQQKIGDIPYEAATWDSLGYAHHHLDQHQQAITCYQRALELVRDLGDRYREADVLTRLGDSHQAAGETDLAREAWKHAFDILEDLDHPDAEQVQTKIG
ncbi:MAG TPA: tetratricopeptide repeat protein [Jiangellaceae bacterium]